MWINARTVQRHMRATPPHHFMLATRQRSEEQGATAVPQYTSRHQSRWYASLLFAAASNDNFLGKPYVNSNSGSVNPDFKVGIVPASSKYLKLCKGVDATTKS